jgi:hypothetical protein
VRREEWAIANFQFDRERKWMKMRETISAILFCIFAVAERLWNIES